MPLLQLYWIFFFFLFYSLLFCFVSHLTFALATQLASGLGLSIFVFEQVNSILFQVSRIFISPTLVMTGLFGIILLGDMYLGRVSLKRPVYRMMSLLALLV